MKWVVEGTTRNLNLAMRLGLGLAGLLWAVTAHAQGAVQDKPAIRAVTAFITIDKDNYAARMDEAAQFLSAAKTALNQAGFAGANGRVTTQPFPQYIKGLKREEALALIGALKQVAANDHVALNIGPAMMNDDDDTSAADLLPVILADNGANASLIVADDKGLHWRAIGVAAHAMHEIAAASPNGNGNFGFATIAMMKPYGPYYPGSWHNGPGKHFAIAMETANVVNHVFETYHDPVEAQAHLTEELSQYTKEAEAVAMKLAAATGWTYEGIDATPAPGRASIATAFEVLLGRADRQLWLDDGRGDHHPRRAGNPCQAHRLFGADDPGDGRQGAGPALGGGNLLAGFNPGLVGGVRGRGRHRALGGLDQRKANRPHHR